MSTTRKVEDLDAFLVVDYSQIELRMLAEASGDKLLIRQFQEAGTNAKLAKANGKDIHCQVGHTLTGWPVEQIANDKDTRKTIKEFHFEIIYGGSKESIYGHLRAKGVKILRQESDAYYDAYFRKYSGVKRYIHAQRRNVEKLGYVETLFGFRRYINPSDERRASYWGNQAINTPIQGAAHQLVLIALALLHIYPKKYRLLRRVLAEVHDALICRVKTRDLPEAYKQAKDLLERAVAAYAAENFGVKFQVPLVVEAEAGYCLGSVVDYEGEPIPMFLEAWRKKHAESETTGRKKLFAVGQAA